MKRSLSVGLLACASANVVGIDAAGIWPARQRVDREGAARHAMRHCAPTLLSTHPVGMFDRRMRSAADLEVRLQMGPRRGGRGRRPGTLPEFPRPCNAVCERRSEKGGECRREGAVRAGECSILLLDVKDLHERERLKGVARHRGARALRARPRACGHTTTACRSGCVYARPIARTEPCARPSVGPRSKKST